MQRLQPLKVIAMYRMLVVAASICCVPISVNAAVFKCSEDGKTVFQDHPCPGTGTAITVKPASGSAPAPANSPKDVAPPTASADVRLKESVHTMELERKQRETEYAIRDTEREIEGYQSQMDRELAGLQNRKGYAANNLAGATWEQSISQEMQAVSEKYRTKIQISQDRLTQLRRDATELGKSR